MLIRTSGGSPGVTAREVTQLHKTIYKMARILEEHAAWEAVQLCGMKEWLEDTETRWDDRHRDNVLWGTGIVEMTVNVLATARVGEGAPTQHAGREERDGTARQDGEGLGASQDAGAVPGG